MYIKAEKLLYSDNTQRHNVTKKAHYIRKQD